MHLHWLLVYLAHPTRVRECVAFSVHPSPPPYHNILFVFCTRRRLSSSRNPRIPQFQLPFQVAITIAKLLHNPCARCPIVGK